MTSNLLTEWVKQRPLPRDKPVRIKNMIFHIPFNGTHYLMFKCRRCGWCCNNPKQDAILLTFADIKRLANHYNTSMSKFAREECVWSEVTEGKEIRPLISLPAVKVQYAGFFLKRFPEENEETIQKPHRCLHLTKDNLCRVQTAKPVTCAKFPYILYKDEANVIHAYYTDIPWSKCQGYQPTRQIRLHWLTPWIQPLTVGAKEIIETLEEGIMQITSITG